MSYIARRYPADREFMEEVKRWSFKGCGTDDLLEMPFSELNLQRWFPEEYHAVMLIQGVFRAKLDVLFGLKMAEFAEKWEAEYCAATGLNSIDEGDALAEGIPSPTPETKPLNDEEIEGELACAEA